MSKEQAADPRVRLTRDYLDLAMEAARRDDWHQNFVGSNIRQFIGQALAALDLAREVALERSVRLQLANDSQAHLDRALKAEADLALNKSMLAKQCDLARQAESDLAAVRTLAGLEKIEREAMQVRLAEAQEDADHFSWLLDQPADVVKCIWRDNITAGAIRAAIDAAKEKNDG